MYILSTLWQKILEWDHELFVTLNSQCTHPFFDTIMPFMRHSITWIPVYLFILVFVLMNFRTKAFWWIVFFLITVTLTDQTGTKLFKYGFERIRPCNSPDMLEHLRLLVRCPSGYSFTSNHAANHFGMATFLFVTFHRLFGKGMLLIFLWAGSIGYAQVYVGVHYPSDIAGGMLLGILAGVITGFLFNKFSGFPVLKKGLP